MSKTAEVTVKTVAGLMVSGAKKLHAEADEFLNKAIREKGESQAIGFPETAFYLPLANALLGLETKTLSDAKKIVATAKTLLPNVPADESKWDTFLKDACRTFFIDVAHNTIRCPRV